MIKDQLKKSKKEAYLAVMESLTIKLLCFSKVFTCSSRSRLFYMCLLKIAKPVCESIFEQTKHPIAIVLASELTVFSYVNVSGVIPRGKRHFYSTN